MGILALPIDLFSHIISLTSPKDACRSLLVSRLFESAPDSDVVWKMFLPSDYEDWWDTIPETIESKKKLYLYLCDNPIRIDNGNMIFSIDRASGKKRVLVGARGLSIARAPQHQQWFAGPEPELAGLVGPEPELATFVRPEFAGLESKSRFPEVAALNAVCGFHVTATVETRILSPQTTYEAYLVFNFPRTRHNFQNCPVKMRVDFEGRQDGEGLNVFLDSRGNIDDIVPQDRKMDGRRL